jgi:filamentous hemagglutinin family protein
MNKIISSLFQASCFAFSSLLASIPAFAQEVPITADGTTDTNITTPDGSNFDINGGDRAGGNLFHSFGNFSVPIGGEAFFNNAADIDNIISRVTGGKISTIEGLIVANGRANLFLINPAGIVFGQNASLNIGGSFLGSTADSLVFPDGEFSAVNAQGKPLLTINAPIGLNFRDNPGDITNRSQAVSSDGISNGLEVKSGQTISLIGGDINLESGRITAPAGRIELGSLNTSGQVTFNDNGSLSFPDGVARGNISLSNRSFVDVTGTQGGNIGIAADNIQMTGNSFLVGGTYFTRMPLSGFQIAFGFDSETNTPGGKGKAGAINLNIADNVTMTDRRSSIASAILEGAEGNGGDINIKTSNLSLANRALIDSSTSGIGNAGNINITADDAVKLSDAGITSNVEKGAIGNSGKIDITAKSLSLDSGAQLQTIAFGFDSKTNTPGGRGDAGAINLNIADNVTITGKNQRGFPSALGSAILEGAEGKGGDINIKARNLFLADGGFLSASNFGVGNGGNIDLKLQDTLRMRNNSSIEAQATVENKAGNITINSPNGFVVASPKQNNDIIATAEEGGGGQITINAKRIYGFDKERIQALDRDNLFINGENDINSTSAEPKLSGSINLNTEQLDPAKERAKAPENVVEPDETVASACDTDGNGQLGNTFTVSGRGGMPPSPTEPLESSLIKVSGTSESRKAEEVKKSDLPQGVLRDRKRVSSDEIIPARGIAINQKGQVVLTRYPTPNSIDRAIPQSNYCSSSLTDEQQSDRYSIVYDDELSLKFDEILKGSIAKFSEKY